MLIEQKKEITKYNNLTGEVLEETKTNLINTKTNNQKDFLFVFTKSIGYLQNLSKSEIHTLFGLFPKVTADNKIYINKQMKEEIAETMSLNFQTVNNSITSLTQKKILGNIARGVYVLNPTFFGKGSFQDMKKIKIFQEFDFDNNTYKTMVEQEFKTEEEKLKKQIEIQKQIIENLERRQEEEENKNQKTFDFEE